MNEVDFLIVGGGVASARAIETLVTTGVAGKCIALLSADREIPYHRPPLSKGYLLGREDRASLFVKPRDFYVSAGVTLHLGTTVANVSPSDHAVTTTRGDAFRYGKLLVATGCVPRRLRVSGGHLPGVFTLRTLADCDAIKDALGQTKTAVVAGGSFIGMELASVFAQRGIATTLLHRGAAVFEKIGSPEASAFFASSFRERGVPIRLEDEVAEVTCGDVSSKLRVRTSRGDTLPADLVAVGIGVTPATEFLMNSGITLDTGVVTNEYLETSAPDVYAAGDVANFFDPLYGRHRRIEHWDTALQHGKIAGTNMAAVNQAQRKPYDLVSSFFSDVFDLSFEYFGDPAGTDRVIRRGAFEERAVTLFFLDNDVVRAAFTMGRPRERKALIELIRSRGAHTTPDRLADTARPLPTATAPTKNLH